MPLITEELDLDAWGAFTENGVTTMLFGLPYKHEYVRAPPGIPDLEPGAKLKVLERFISDHRCPYGAGNLCLRVEAGLVAVFTCSSRGIAWLRHEMPPIVENVVVDRRRV